MLSTKIKFALSIALLAGSVFAPLAITSASAAPHIAKHWQVQPDQTVPMDRFGIATQR